MVNIYELLFIGNSHLSQFNLNRKNIHELRETGASIKGLVNPDSRLQLRHSINNFIDNNTSFSCVFFLGQVDIEFGYYYKSIVDNIKYNINDYYNDLIKKYESYLKSLKCNFYILSINPTTIIDVTHIFNVCFRCNNGNIGYYSEHNINIVLTDEIKSILDDSYEVRMLNNKLFNTKLEEMCLKNGFKYIDFWDFVTENNKVKGKYMPSTNDHHLNIVDDTELLDYILEKIKKC